MSIDSTDTQLTHPTLGIIVRVAALIAPLFLCACSLSGYNAFNDDAGIFRNAADDYLTANTLDPIKIPPHLNSRAIGQRLNIPETNALVTSTATVPPPPLTIKRYIPKVSIQQVDDKRWILVAQPTSEVWPLIVNFLMSNELTIADSNISKGTLETHWLALTIDPGNTNKYWLRVDGGMQPDTAEIHIVNRVQPKDKVNSDRVNSTIAQPQVSTNTARENWMIDELVAFLTNGDSALGESLLAQSVGNDNKVHLRQQQGELVLAVKLDKQRVYASLARALTQEQLILYQQDRERGIFHVDYLPTVDKKKSSLPGAQLIDKLNPFKGNEQAVSRHTLDDIIAHLPPSPPQIRNIFPYAHANTASNSKTLDNKTLDNVAGYLVAMIADTDRELVYIRDGYGRPLPPRQSKRLLTLIRQQLI